MTRKLVNELIIPPEVGRGLIVKQGQTLRIIAIEGPQVADVAFINAHDHSDSYAASVSYMANAIQGTGNYFRFKYLYSRLPRANLLVEITDDKIARHWLINGGHCSTRSGYTRRLLPSSRSCHGNVAEVIAQYGMPIDQVPNTFPLWMYIEDHLDGEYSIHPSPAQKGHYIDFLAHMDVLVAISACPADAKDPTPGTLLNPLLNGGVNKPLKAEVWEDSG